MRGRDGRNRIRGATILLGCASIQPIAAISERITFSERHHWSGSLVHIGQRRFLFRMKLDEVEGCSQDPWELLGVMSIRCDVCGKTL